MSDVAVEECEIDLHGLSEVLRRFAWRKLGSRDERERFAACEATTLKTRIDALRDRAKDLPPDLKKDLTNMRLVEVGERRAELMDEIKRLNSEELKIKRES